MTGAPVHTQPAVSLKRAGIADAGLLVTLVREFCDIDGHAFDQERVRAALIPLLENDQHGLVWMMGDPPSGYAVVTWGYSIESGGRDALLDELYLRRRGEGLGALAIEQILTDLGQRGLKRIFLETEKPNEAVRRFYARHGFRQEDSVWMSRPLP